jgi:hypothetical protein
MEDKGKSVGKKMKRRRRSRRRVEELQQVEE